MPPVTRSRKTEPADKAKVLVAPKPKAKTTVRRKKNEKEEKSVPAKKQKIVEEDTHVDEEERPLIIAQELPKTTTKSGRGRKAAKVIEPEPQESGSCVEEEEVEEKPTARATTKRARKAKTPAPKEVVSKKVESPVAEEAVAAVPTRAKRGRAAISKIDNAVAPEPKRPTRGRRAKKASESTDHEEEVASEEKALQKSKKDDLIEVDSAPKEPVIEKPISEKKTVDTQASTKESIVSKKSKSAKQDNVEVQQEVIHNTNGQLTEQEAVEITEKNNNEDSSVECVTKIEKVVYKKKTNTNSVVKQGTIDFRLTSNNSLYLEMNKDVAMVVEKLKIETEQSFNEENAQAEESASEVTSEVNSKMEVSLPEQSAVLKTTFMSTPNSFLSETKSNDLNSTMDNFTSNKRKLDISEEDDKEPKRKTLGKAGKIMVFGEDIAGELGLGEIGVAKQRPFPIDFDVPVIEVSSLSQHNAVVSYQGKVYTFGCNDECALGRVTSESDDPELLESTPYPVDLSGTVVKATTGDSHTAVLTDMGAVYYWGGFRDSNGVIGLTPEIKKPTLVPQKIALDKTFYDIASGGNFLLLLTKEGHLYSLGNGERGELGRLASNQCKFDKNNPELFLEPALVRFSNDILCEKIWCGEFSAFALAKDGRVFSWGLNNYFQLGIHHEENQDLSEFFPVEIPFFKNHSSVVEKIAQGQHHSLAIDAEGRIFSFGRGDYGRLGHGESSAHIATPSQILALADEKIVEISCGTCTSFAITEKGELYSWGMGSATLGQGSDDDSRVPALVKSKHLVGKKVHRVSAGAQHCLILVVED